MLGYLPILTWRKCWTRVSWMFLLQNSFPVLVLCSLCVCGGWGVPSDKPYPFRQLDPQLLPLTGTTSCTKCLWQGVPLHNPPSSRQCNQDHRGFSIPLQLPSWGLDATVTGILGGCRLQDQRGSNGLGAMQSMQAGMAPSLPSYNAIAWQVTLCHLLARCNGRRIAFREWTRGICCG